MPIFNYFLGLMAAVIVFTPMAATAQDRSARGPNVPDVRTASVIPCPEGRVEFGPNAKDRVDAGEVPVTIPSYFAAGLSRGNGLCIVRVLSDGKLYKQYAEVSRIGNLPIRVDFGEYGLSVFEGQRHQDLTTPEADIDCNGPTDFSPQLRCNMLVHPGLTVEDTIDTTRTYAVYVESKRLFNQVVTPPSILDFTRGVSDFGFGLDLSNAYANAGKFNAGTRREIKCDVENRDNLAWDMRLVSVPPGNVVKLLGSPEEMDQDTQIGDVKTFSQFYADGDTAKQFFALLGRSNKAHLTADMACGDDVTVELGTQRVRTLYAIQNAIISQM